MSEREEKVYCGSAKEVGTYGSIAVLINLDEAVVTEYNGNRYIKVVLDKKRTPTDKATHSVRVDNWKPKSQTVQSEDEIPM